MDFLKSLVAAGATALIVMNAAPVAAESDLFRMDLKLYGGFSIGYTDIGSGVQSVSGNARLDEDDIGGKIYVGLAMNRLISLELHYADFGEASVTSNAGGAFTANNILHTFQQDNSKVVIDHTSIGLGAVFGYPVTEWMTPFVRGGVHFWWREAAANQVSFLPATVSNLEEDGIDPFAGAGLDLNLYRNLWLRGEYDLFRFDGDNVHLFAAGALYRF